MKYKYALVFGINVLLYNSELQLLSINAFTIYYFHHKPYGASYCTHSNKVPNTVMSISVSNRK